MHRDILSLAPSSLDRRRRDDVLDLGLDVGVDECVEGDFPLDGGLELDEGLEEAAEVGRVVGRVGCQGCLGATAGRVADDRDVADPDLEDGVVQHRVGRVVVGVELVGNVALYR